MIKKLPKEATFTLLKPEVRVFLPVLLTVVVEMEIFGGQVARAMAMWHAKSPPRDGTVRCAAETASWQVEGRA